MDVSQDVIIRSEDCFAGSNEKIRGIVVQEIREDNEAIEPLADRIIGRYTAEPVIHPETGEVIIGENQLITPETGRQIIDAGIEECHIRSVLTCGKNMESAPGVMAATHRRCG